MPNRHLPINCRALLRSLLAIVLATTFLSAARGFAQGYQPTPENLQARREFQDMKFGMFIHWGVYSVLGDGEWVFHERHLTVDEYNRLPQFFDPEKFDAATWVALAKAAGMKYITITSRHHDGFAMFDSKVSDWNIVARTPYKKDPLKMLADECHRQGIKLFFYYSQLDWHNPDYFPRGQTNWNNGRPDHGDLNSYLDTYMDGQLTELLTNYGPIAGIWFDGMWDKPDADWHLDKTYALIHKLQPAALIIPNHHQTPRPGEDVQTFERDLPGQNTAGFNTNIRQHEYSARKFRHAERRLGIQHRRQQLQKRPRSRAQTGPRRRQQFQPAAEYRPLSQRRDRSAIRHPPARRRRLARKIWRLHLRHPRRPHPARRLGSHHAKRKQNLCPRAELGIAAAGPAADRGKNFVRAHAARRRVRRCDAKCRRRNPETPRSRQRRSRPSNRADDSEINS